MNQSELKELLRERNQKADWDSIRGKFSPESTLIEGKETYKFYTAVDIASDLVEGNIAISQQPYGSYIPFHVHNYVELTYVYEGECTVEVQNKEIILKRGSFIFVDKEIPHRVRETKESDIIMNIILKTDYLSPAFLSRLSNHSIISSFLVDSLVDSRRRNKFLLFHANEQSEHQIYNAMEHLMCEYYDKQAYSQEIIDSYLIILFTEMIRFNEYQHQVEKVDSNSHSLIDFLKYIETHFKDCNLTTMAEHFNFHPNYLTALLKQGTGKSFKELLQIQKLSNATFLLKNSDLPIEQIVYEVGYSSISFFYRKFKSIYGMTPIEFRNIKQLLH